MKVWKIIGLGILSTALLTGCMEDKEFPPEPHLEFLSFTEDPNDPIMKFRFTDGDGNVGLDARDTLPPFQPEMDPVNPYHWNLWLKYYYRDSIDSDGWKWVEIELDPNTAFSRIPRLDPQGQNKALEGEVIIDMEGWYPLFSNHDTIRYGAILLDRDQNHSPEALSDPIILNQ